MNAVERAVAAVSSLFRAHGGGVALSAERNGEIELRFTGMCAGCPSRPVCLATTVRPALLAVRGVRSVTAAGTRIDPSAAARLAAFTDSGFGTRSAEWNAQADDGPVRAARSTEPHPSPGSCR